MKSSSHDSQDDSQFQRLKRSVVRLTKRYHKQERVVRILEPAVNGNGRHHGNGHGLYHGHHSNGNGLHSDQIHNGVNGNGHYNFPRKETNRKSFLGVPKLQSAKKLEKIERLVADQHQEIQSLKDCVAHLRGSLQLSDAQNLALQVMLKKVSKSESKLPSNKRMEKTEFRNQMKKSEQQLENLVTELREMSQMKYPTIANSNHYHSGSVFSFNGNSCKNPDLGISEDELLSVHDSITGVKRELGTTQKRLHRISQQIDPSSDPSKSDSSMLEAYEALLKTEAEIENLR